MSATVARLHRRQRRARGGWALCGAAFVVTGGAMAWILLVVLVRGAAALSPRVFLEVTHGAGGGLLNAIEGTLLIGLGSMILAVPVGVAAGVFVAEFPETKLAGIIRFSADVLVGVPSIVLGYFGYITMVVGLGWHFSLAAASITLAILCLPYICRTTEQALLQVPPALREAAFALGAGDARVAWRIALPAASPGILTGILLAFAISVGETAPLIYTAGWSSYLWSGALVREPVGYLTYAIWAFINEPFAAANALAYAAALLVMAIVLVTSAVARFVLLRGHRKA